MWSTFACRASCTFVATSAFASSSSSRRVEKRTHAACVGGKKAPHAAARLTVVAAASDTTSAPYDTENVIPRVEGEFQWDDDRPFTRHRDLEYFKQDLGQVQYGGLDAGTVRSRADRIKLSKSQLPSPVTYKVTTPSSYDANRTTPYPVVIIIPADAGYGGVLGSLSGTQAVCYESGRNFHERNDCIICELGFNRPTWVADTSTTNHESFVLDVVLPHLCTEYNVGRLNLLGYHNGGVGALHLLMRHPDLFHRVAVADVPILGDFEGILRPWGVEEFDPDTDIALKPNWRSFVETFPHNDMFAPYSVGALATCEATAGAMRGHQFDRIGLWAGSNATWEMNELTEQFDEFEVPHKYVDTYTHQPGDWQGGWVDEALRFLAEDL